MILLLEKGLCMNISSVNYQQPLSSFKGLWGKTHIQNSNYNRGHCIIKYFEYHPYADESTEAAQNIADSRSKYKWKHETEKTVLYKSIVDIKDKLPFSKEEFDLYKNLKGKKQNAICIKVEKGLADAKIYKYINNRFIYFLSEFYLSAKKMILKAL